VVSVFSHRLSALRDFCFFLADLWLRGIRFHPLQAFWFHRIFASSLRIFGRAESALFLTSFLASQDMFLAGLFRSIDSYVLTALLCGQILMHGRTGSAVSYLECRFLLDALR